MQRVKRPTAVAVLPTPPEGGTPGYFAAPNPQGGIDATVPGYEWFNAVQEEICAVVEAAGITLDEGDQTQLVAALIKKGMQGNHFSIATAAGTADAITAAFTPAITVLTHGMTLHVRAGAANATTTPTFTPAAGTIVAKTIVKGAGAALVAGDIIGSGHWIDLQYDQTLDKWVLLNPATGVTSQRKQIQSITAVVAANALTLGLNPTSLDFRSSSLTSGVPNTRAVGAISLVVPSGATLGTVSGQAARLALIAIDNVGTIELAVVNLSGGINLDETTLITTTAISAGATSASTIYSTAARAAVPFRVVGFIDITEVVAGTWATAPTVIQGQGGQAIVSAPTLMAPVDVKASRSAGMTYYNTSGRWRFVAVSMMSIAANVIQYTVNGVTGYGSSTNAANITCYAAFWVPPGGSYSATIVSGTVTVTSWLEY